MAHSFCEVFDNIKGLEDLSKEESKFTRIGSGVYRFKPTDGSCGAVVKIKGTDPEDAKSEYKLLQDIQSGYPVEYREIDMSGFIAMPSFEEVDIEQQARNSGISESDLNKIKENYLLINPVSNPAPKEENYFVNSCKKAQLEVQTLRNLYQSGFYNFDFKPNNIMMRDEQFVIIDLDSCINTELFRVDNIAITDGHCFRAKNSRGYDLFDNIDQVNSLPRNILDKVAQMVQWDNLIHCIGKILLTDKITQGRYLNPLLGIGYSDFLDESYTVSSQVPPVFPSVLPVDSEGWYSFFQEKYFLNLNHYKSREYLPFVQCFADFLMKIRKNGLRGIADGRDFEIIISSLSQYLYFMEYSLQYNNGQLFQAACSSNGINSALLKSEFMRPSVINKIGLMRLGFEVSDFEEVDSYESEGLSPSLIEEMSNFWENGALNKTNLSLTEDEDESESEILIQSKAEGNRFDDFLIIDQNDSGESLFLIHKVLIAFLLTEALCSYGVGYLSMRIFALF